MTTNTNIKYTPSKNELYKLELAAERINALLKTLDTTGNNKTLEELNAIVETIKDWDYSDDSLSVKEQLLNIYNSMLSEEEFGYQMNGIDNALDSIIEMQNTHMGGTSDETV
jgi:hypothetical protein